MAFPVRMISEKVDSIVIDVSPSPKYAEFVDYMNLVAILSDVDCYVKFNSAESKPIPIVANLVYNYFFPIKMIIVYSENGIGKLYAWGEKV